MIAAPTPPMSSPHPPPTSDSSPLPSDTSSPSSRVCTALLDSLLPSLRDTNGRLLELQESQTVLLTGVSLASVELAAGDADWRAARETLERVPAYTARVQRLRKDMAAASASLARTEKGAAALQARLGAKASERQARRQAERAAYGGGSGEPT